MERVRRQTIDRGPVNERDGRGEDQSAGSLRHPALLKNAADSL